MSERRVIGPYTAYTIAVKHGYKGTEAEWVAEQEKLHREAREAANEAKTALTEMQKTKTEAEKSIADVGAAQQKNVNDAGTAQVNSINKAGTTQNNNVNAAGAAQVKQINATGAEILASIPEDYKGGISKLSGEIIDPAHVIVAAAGGESVTLDDAAEGYAVRGFGMIGKSTQAADPTPDAPQPIVNVQEPNIVVNGRNLLDTSKSSPGFLQSDGTTTGQNSFGVMTSDYIPVHPAQSYVICREGSVMKNANLLMQFYDAGKQILSSHSMVENYYTASKDAAYMRMSYFNTYPYIIAEGTEAVPYEPYQEQRGKLTGITLRSLGSVHDELIVKADGTGTLVQRIDPKLDEQTTTADHSDCILATPIVAAISAEQVQALLALTMHSPVTRISNDFGAEMSVSYVAEQKKYIDKKFDELFAAISST